MKDLTPLRILFLLFLSIGIMACDDDDDDEPVNPIEPTPTGRSVTYDLDERAVEGISGTAKFIELSDNSTTVELNLENTPGGGQHPAHIHFNTAVEGGAIAVTLATVDGSTGMSSINFSKLDDGTAITYSELLEYNGYINVHLSADDLSTIVAQGDIGQNALNGVMMSYPLNEKAVAGISGTATFYQRNNGDFLAVLELQNTPDGGVHPAHIHDGNAATGGGIAFTFNPVDGTTGMSKTNISSLPELNDFDGYINVHLSADDLTTIVAQGDIGQNALTGDSKTYVLAEKAVPGISGTATFYERNSGAALVTIELENTPEGGIHPAHIHENDAATGGGIVFTFNPVDGTTGKSSTHMAAKDDGSDFGYAEALVFNGHINVHLSAESLGTVVAQGDIGSNETQN